MASLTGTIGSATSARLGDTGGSPKIVGRWIVQLSGTWVGTVLFEGIVRDTADGANPLTLASNKYALTFQDVALTTQTAGATGTTANGIFSVVADGMNVQLRCSAYTSGTIVWNAVPVAG